MCFPAWMRFPAIQQRLLIMILIRAGYNFPPESCFNGKLAFHLSITWVKVSLSSGYFSVCLFSLCPRKEWERVEL